MAACSPGALADLAWALARLRYQPSEEWEAAAAARVGVENMCLLGELSFGKAALMGSPSFALVTATCLARPFFKESLRPLPNAPPAQVSDQLQVLQPQQLGCLLWAWRAVQLEVPEAWTQAFLEKAGEAYPPRQLKVGPWIPSSRPLCAHCAHVAKPPQELVNNII